MGPRKNNATAAGKDDGVALGKMRKINTTNGNSNKLDGNSSAVADVGYTNEERVFLESQLSLFHANKGATSGGIPTAATDYAAMTKERWMSGLPLLISATEKLLRLAADQYQITCTNRAAAAATQKPAAGGVGPTAGPSGNAHERDASFSEIGRPTPNHGNNNASMMDGALSATPANLPAARPTPAAGTAAQFVEENAYILAQAQQLQWFPFTYQRWLELLLDPGKFHTAKSEGRLRGDAIQASLRRCILVTYPAVEGGDCI
jgi:hypothetical protein